MADDKDTVQIPARVAAIAGCGFALWADEGVNAALRARFPEGPIKVAGVRHVRVWGIQVDDERELPGLERTQIPDEDIWEINLEAADGSHFEVDSRLLRPASD